MWSNFNGRIVEFEKAGLPLNDLGIVRGFGYFDYLRTYEGKPLLFDEHLARLVRSSNIIGLPVPYPLDQIKTWVMELLKKNNYPESHIKIIVTGGPSEDGMTVTSPSFYILVYQAFPYPEECFTKGITVMTHEHLRLFPEAKTLNYMTALALSAQKKEIGAMEVVYYYKGQLLEASTSNIFLFKGNTLITPKQDILEGITRAKIIEIAKRTFTVECRDIAIAELFEADEVFITASNKEVMPVTTVDTRKIRNGTVGENTKKMLQLYRAFISAYTRQ